jgi:hypothetical protein
MALRLGGLGLIALVVLGLGFLVGRASAPKGTSTVAGSTTASAAPGASRAENGVPVGYLRTREGAVAAATNFAKFAGGPLILQPDKFRAAIGSLAAPESKTKLLNEYETGLAATQNSTQIITNAGRGVKVAVNAYPLAYHVANFSSNVSEVNVWYLTVLAQDGQAAPAQSWVTMTVDLEWTDGDWKVTSDGSAPGPVPLLGQAPVQTKQLPTQLSDYQVYGYLAGP